MQTERISPLTPDLLDEPARELMERDRAAMGFLPNDGLTMARVPGLLQAVTGLAECVYRGGRVEMEIKRLVALMSSMAAGCVYCQHHARHGGLRNGIDEGKLDAPWSYETSAAFNPADRAALAVARRAALQPNQVRDADFENLRSHYDQHQCAEIVAVVALFGFLNRWNDTIRTAPEAMPHPQSTTGNTRGS